MKQIILLATLLLSPLTFAQNLIAVATDQGGYPAKALCFFSNNHMVPYSGDLLVLYTCLGGPDLNSEIWLVKDEPQNIGVSKMGNLFSAPAVRGKAIYFFEYNEFSTVALWKSENGILTSIAIPESLKGSHVTDLSLVGETFYFRFKNRESGQNGEGIFTDVLTVLPERAPTFFHKASANGEIMIQKTMLPVGEVVELRTKQSPEPMIILRDNKADPSSPFLSLRNQFALRGTKWATFARTVTGLTLIRGENETFETEELSQLFKDVQHWPPALRQDGEIVFRGTDLNGVYALWGYKDGVKRVIVGSNQEIREGSETVVTSSRSLLYNDPVIDEAGNLFIGVGLRDPQMNSDFGQGILKLTGPDGSENSRRHLSPGTSISP